MKKWSLDILIPSGAVPIVQVDEPIRVAVRRMQSTQISICVVQFGKQVVGVYSMQDALRNICDEVNLDSEIKPHIKPIGYSNSAQLTDDLPYIIRRLVTPDLNYIVILSNARLVGLLTTEKLVELYLAYKQAVEYK